MKKIVILTSGGDSPGMAQAVIAATEYAISLGYDIFYSIDGYRGLYENNIVSAKKYDLDWFANRGGSFIGSARLPEFKEAKVRKVAIKNLHDKGIKNAIIIGGDGSYRGAIKLSEEGINCITLPGTIDNDITSSQFTIGFDTAINTIQQAVKRVKDTMDTHKSCGVIEAMGRNCSDLAVYGGIAGGADIISIHEHKLSYSEMKNMGKRVLTNRGRGLIIVVAEHLYENLDEIVANLQKDLGIPTRKCVLAHTQRGGDPTAMEAYRSKLLAFAAIDALENNETGMSIAWNNNKPEVIDIDIALKVKRTYLNKIVEKYNKLHTM